MPLYQLLSVALLLLPSQPEPVTSVKVTRSGQDWPTGYRVVQILNWHREFLSITSHTPLHSPVCFSCSAETLASAAATAPADSWDQKVPLNPLQQLHSICDHWFGDRSCSVCQLLFPFLVNKVTWSYSHNSISAGDPLQNKQMAPSLRHTASECAASFPRNSEPATFPVCFGHKSIKLQSYLVQRFKNKSI